MPSQILHKRPPGRVLFFLPLAVALTPSYCERIDFAYRVSKNGNAGKFREDGSRAFDHPKAAAWIYIHELKGRDPRQIVDIFLHDELEDNFLMTPFRISLNFGKDSAFDVVAVTKIKGETTEEYLGRIIDQGPWAILAKLCDRLHNVRTLYGCSAEKRAYQLEETQKYHIPLLIPALQKHGGQWAEYADIMEQKIREAIVQY
jgi:(p)ppGpp synthase/HD superfamily hydrolase